MKNVAKLMWMKLVGLSNRRWVAIALVFVLFLVILVSRRWQQVVSPQVWSEDGVVVLPSLINHGWNAFMQSVNDYLVTVPKAISAISLRISIFHYPLISTLLSWLFAALVGVAIAIAPTKIRGKFFCALAVFIIPSAPEVFLLPVYTFWWASLLLFLIALWDEERSNPVWRLVLLFLGGLSSPIVIILLPVLYLRAYLYRSKRLEIIIALLASIMAVVQLSFIIASGSVGAISLSSVLFYAVSTFLGNFLVGNLFGLLWVKLAAGSLLVIILALWANRNKSSLRTWVLLYLFAMVILAAAPRVPLSVIHPKLTAPRYLFFPYILIFWMLIDYCYSAKFVKIRVFIVLLLGLAVINSLPVWFHGHKDLQWKDHLMTSINFTEYRIPVMTDTYMWNWNMPVTDETSRRLLERDLLLTKEEIMNAPTYPYSVLPYEECKKDISPVEMTSIVSSTMVGRDGHDTILPGYQVIGTYSASGKRGGSISLKLSRGDKLLYRSSGQEDGNIIVEGYEEKFIATMSYVFHDWVVLDFSNSKLPDDFVIKVEDNRKEKDAWCAVALKIEN